MTTARELREKRAAAWAAVQEHNERHKAGETMSAENEEAWQRGLADVDALSDQIENRERTEALETRFAEIDRDTVVTGAAGDVTDRSTVPDDYRAAFERFVRFGLGELEPAEQQLIRSNYDPNVRAQGIASGAAGGYTVPEGFWAKVTETMKWYGGAADGADDFTTSTGAPLPWPTNDDTANEGYYLGENVQTTNEGDLVYGQNSLNAHTLVSGPILLSLQLAQDSGIDIESRIAMKMGERLGRRANRAMTTGDGVDKPAGFVPGSTTGATTSSATEITYDEIVDLVHSVDVAYRATGRARFKMHDLVLAYIRKIRDDSGGAGVGRPIWEPSVQAGVPNLLLGYPYSLNNDMDSTVATTNKTMSFGDFMSGFAIRRVSGGQMMRLTERYADFLQVGFIGFERHDSLVQDPSAIKLLVQA